MKHIQFCIDVDEGVSNYLRRLHYEINSYRNVITNMIILNQDNPEILNSKSFNQYYEQYLEKFVSYEILLNEILQSYIPTSLPRLKSLYTYQMDYTIHTLQVEMREDVYLKWEKENLLCDKNIDGK